MKTARAVIIDENPRESLHLMQALGSVGVGAVYFSGDNPDYFPKERLEGIRVVFLDLNLIGQNEANLYVPHAVHVLKSCVELKPRSTGIICWTTHEDELAPLNFALADQNVEPSFVLSLRDKSRLVDQGANSANELIGQLKSHLDNQPGHKLLVEWEQTSHCATTHSSERLVDLSRSDSDLLKLLATIANAAADESPQSADQTIRALIHGLGAIYHDSLEDVADRTLAGNVGDAVHKEIGRLRDEPPTQEQRARLNSILLTTTSDKHRPGNVYLVSSFDDSKNSPDNKEVRRYINEVFFSKRSRDDCEWWKQFVNTVENASRICGVEITPPCDHAQSKAKSARMILGLLIQLGANAADDSDIVIPIESRAFAKEIEPLYVANEEQGLNGTYKLVLNARHLQTKALDKIGDIKPLFRLRSGVVADIQAWFASHAARPGYVSIR